MSHIGGDWYEDVDTASGAPYYTNYSTGEVTWNRPTDLPDDGAGAGGGGEWVETLDEASGKYYYLNSVTGESRWDNPNGGGDSGGGETDPSDPSENPANWTSGVDESSGYTYYYNAVTQVTQWDLPACLNTGTSVSDDVEENRKQKEEEEEEKKRIQEEEKAAAEIQKKKEEEEEAKRKAEEEEKKKQAENDKRKASVAPPPPKKSTVAPPPPKKSSVAPPPPPPQMQGSGGSSKSSVIPPPALKKELSSSATTDSKKVSVMPPAKSSTSPKKKVSIAPTPSESKKDFPVVDDNNEDSSTSTLAEPSKLTGGNDDNHDVSSENALEGVKNLKVGRESKRATFAALRSLDSTEEAEEEVDSDTEVEPRGPRNLMRDTSFVVNAPAESAIGHRQSTIQMLPSKDEPTTHDLCEQVIDKTFQQYGEKNYNFERKGLFKGRTTIEKMTTWKSDLIKTSLRILSPELVGEAVQTFKNVTGYMKDRSSSKHPIDHAIKILNLMMLAPEELRDELYCQLCKQTNKNPNPESTECGWQLFMICLATFPPSFDLMPHLMSYFVENLTHEIPNCARYAEICLHRCPKICKLGARRELPTKLELETIRRGGLATVRVFFLDGKYANLKVDSWTTVRELEDSLATLLNIRNKEPFSLCEVSSTEEERVPDPDERILGIISYWDRTANEAHAKGASDVEEFCFQYKIGLFYDIDDTDMSAIELVYIQATHDIVDSRYPCSEQDSITLAALQMQEEYGDYPGDGRCTYLRGNLGKYLAAHLIQQSDATTLENQIYALYAKLTGYSQLEARLSYLDYVKSWKIYGSTYFFVEPQNSKDLPKECVLAVNNKGITVVSPTTKEFLAEYNYSTVVTWGHSPNSFVIVTGTKTRQIKIYFKTEQGKELNNMVQSYIEHRKT